MHKSKIIAAATAASMLTCALALWVQGDELIYDSQNDPLVSLSYINDVVIAEYDKKLDDIEKKISDLTKENEELKNKNNSLQILLSAADEQISELQTKLSEISDTAASGYEIVCLKKGQKLLATEPCEIILRSGTAIVVSITSNGVNDLTSGVELANAESAPIFHSLLIPRGNDGRGIQVTSTEAYIMVRGGHEIVD